MTKPNERPMSPKQKAYFKNVASGMTPHQAALKAGYSPKSAGNSAANNTKKYKDYWSDLLDKAGANDMAICETIAEGLKSTKVVGYLQNLNKDKDGQLSKVAPDKCVSNEFVEVADYPTRAKYVNIALKLKNAYPATKIDLTERKELLIDE